MRGQRPPLAKIRKLLRDNPGATIKGVRGEDGQTRYTIVGPDRRTPLERLKQLTALKARAEAAEFRLLKARAEEAELLLRESRRKARKLESRL